MYHQYTNRGARKHVNRGGGTVLYCTKYSAITFGSQSLHVGTVSSQIETAEVQGTYAGAGIVGPCAHYAVIICTRPGESYTHMGSEPTTVIKSEPVRIEFSMTARIGTKAMLGNFSRT